MAKVNKFVEVKNLTESPCCVDSRSVDE